MPSLLPCLLLACAKQWCLQKLQPALSKALTALAREKPSAERFEAITFLADYLLKNNPNKPRIVMPDQWDPRCARPSSVAVVLSSAESLKAAIMRAQIRAERH